jgi:hypothetical protein
VELDADGVATIIAAITTLYVARAGVTAKREASERAAARQASREAEKHHRRRSSDSAFRLSERDEEP